MNRSLLMCSPDYFDVVYKINPWMDTQRGVDKKKTKKQWQNLVRTFKKLGFSVDTIEPVEGLPDMVFAANGSFAIGKKALISHYRYPQRKDEARYHWLWFEKNGFSVSNTSGIHYEGQGDTFLVGDTIFQGFGFRSDKDVAKVMRKAFPKKKVVLLELVDDRFYHMDICFFPINKELVFYYSKAYTKEAVAAIKKHFKKAIDVTDEEALSFGLNSISAGNTAVLTSTATKFADRLKALGFKTILVDMSEFAKSGGAVKCVTNEIWEE